MPAMNTADLGLPVEVPSTALFTDQYELTMLQAALKAGTAERRSVFEVFTRRLPEGRRYGVVAGTAGSWTPSRTSASTRTSSASCASGGSSTR